MTLIDHRVLVSAPPEIVWELLSDLTAQPKWHTNITQCRILTTHQTGEDVRYRQHTKHGPDLVCQILSWYNNLGYEYMVIDGPFGQNRGRIRLQAIPEGTVVQWTFEYEYRGLGGALRDRAGVKRRLDKEAAESLKQFKRLVESAGIRMDSDTRDRVSMKPAPNAEERASLSETITRTQITQQITAQRPPASPAAEPVTNPLLEDRVPAEPVRQETSLPTPEHTPAVIIEPPIADDDTRPNPSIQQQDGSPEPPSTGTEEPITRPMVEVVNKLVAEPADILLDDEYEEPPTEPKRPAALDAAIAQEQSGISETVEIPDDTGTKEPVIPPVIPVEELPEAAEPADLTPPEPIEELPATKESANLTPPVQEELPAVEPVDLAPSMQQDETPTPVKDTTPVSMPTVSASETEPPDSPESDEPVGSTPASPVASETAPPEKQESQFTDTIDSVLSGEQARQEQADAAASEAIANRSSLLEQEIKPLGPSIWDVFGMTAPSAEDAAVVPPAADTAPPQASPPDPTEDAAPPVEIEPTTVSTTEASESIETPAKKQSEQLVTKPLRKIIAVRPGPRHPGWRKQANWRSALVRSYKRRQRRL